MRALATLTMCLLMCAALLQGCSRHYARIHAQSNLGVSVYEEENVTGLMTGFPVQTPQRVDLDNWLTAPANRWALQHTSELLPTAQISRGTGAIASLKRQPIVLSVLQFDDVDGNPMTIYDMLRSTYTDGFIVLRRGKIISEQYFNGMRPDTKHLAGSLSEALVGTLAGLAVKRGRIKLKSLVVEYVPELRATAFEGATIQQVLDMKVPLPMTKNFSGIQKQWLAHLHAAGWAKSKQRNPIGIYPFLQTLQKDETGGQAFRYAPANTDTAGWIIERTTGRHLPDALSRDIWSKLGAEHDAYITLDGLGTAFAAAGFCATLRDLARFGQMHLQSGYYNDRQIVPAEWIAEIRGSAGTSAPDEQSAPWSTIYPNYRYRNNWHVADNKHGVYFSMGIYGQHLWIDPVAKVVIVKLSSTPQPYDDKMIRNTYRGFQTIADALMKH